MPRSAILEEMAAAAAFQRGRAARNNGIAQSLNEHVEGGAEHDEWRRGWLARDAELAAEELKRQRAMRASACAYRTGTICNCGGRGLCLDVA